MTGQPDDPIVRLLSSLIEGNVEFIVVGGAAAVLSGGPVVTKDLDIVHKRSPGSVGTLAVASQGGKIGQGTLRLRTLRQHLRALRHRVA